MRLKSITYLFLLFVLIGASNDDARKANEAYENAEYELAEELYRAAMDAEPDNANIVFNLGNALAKQGKVEDAIQMYLQYSSMVESAEELAQAEYNIGTLLSENQQWKPAVQHLRNALKYNPGDADTKHNFERALAESQNEEEEQQQQQDQNQEQEPPSDYAKAMKKRAEELVRQQQYGEAFQLMQQALQVDQTVQNYNQFIQRIGAVSEIDS
ncbi:MAG: tetratricopeptide repeat protein [Balneolaceae bacterium]|nr:tetratricopeptide repeat protein [Balneolaceae bacterium]